MKNLKKLLKLVSLYLPSKLPMGVSDFNNWADSIIEASGLPNNDSMKGALAATIMHLDATSAFKPKIHFVKVLIKGAASQVAHSIFQELKNKQQEEIKQQALQQQAAAKSSSSNSAVVSENKDDQGLQKATETVV